MTTACCLQLRNRNSRIKV